MKKITEAMIQRGVLDYLIWFSKSHPVYFFRSGSGQVKTEQGNFFKTGSPGCPDISCVYQGQYWGLEIKNKTGRQSSLQKQAEAEIVAASGKYFIVRSLEDIKKIFPMDK